MDESCLKIWINLSLNSFSIFQIPSEKKELLSGCRCNRSWLKTLTGRRHAVQNKAHCRPVNLQPVLLRLDNCKFHFDEGQNRGANVVVCCRGSALAIGLIALRFCVLPARSVTAINPLRNGGRGVVKACKSEEFESTLSPFGTGISYYLLYFRFRNSDELSLSLSSRLVSSLSLSLVFFSGKNVSRKIRIVRFLSGGKPGSTRVSSICSTTRVTVNAGDILELLSCMKKNISSNIWILLSFFFFFFFGIGEILNRFWYGRFFVY